MPEFKIIDVPAQPYFYIEKRCSMDPEDISAQMGAAFGEVWAFMERHGVAPAGGALSAYYDYSEPENRMEFRAGFTIARNDMSAADGTVKAAETPAGKALHFTHRGSYATLRDDYALMMQHLQDNGLRYIAPTWEIYVNSPDQVHEEQLLTECYQALADA